MEASNLGNNYKAIDFAVSDFQEDTFDGVAEDTSAVLKDISAPLEVNTLAPA